MTLREPVLNRIKVKQLRPTQITVGFREVAEKRREWRQLPKTKRATFLARHMVPVLLGPKGRAYLTDHHHLARALLDEGEETVLINVIADLSMLSKDAFWVFTDNRGWCHPYDGDGRRVGFKQIPRSVAELVDDPFRSLAGALRSAGGYAKDITPFAEFLWADALRRQIPRAQVETSFQACVVQALDFAKSHDARFLPGWCGSSGELPQN